MSTHTSDRQRLAPRRRARASARSIVLAAAVVSSVLLAAGCGGGSATPGVASVASTAATTSQSSAKSDGSKDTGSNQTFSACMRSHGVPKFPDANPNGGIAIDAKSGINPDSPQFKAAQKACQKLAPNGGKAPSPEEQAKAQAQMLKFSACMRSHGLPNFPDPTFSGGGAQLRVDRKSGLNPNSPQFQAAQKACQKQMPGGGPRNTTNGGGSEGGQGE